MTKNPLVYEISKWDEFQWTEFVETHPETELPPDKESRNG
jgi:hypothetical protein